jgi:hypothetical protein
MTLLMSLVAILILSACGSQQASENPASLPSKPRPATTAEQRPVPTARPKPTATSEPSEKIPSDAPRAKQIMADLIGSQMDGWRFDSIDEFLNFQIDRVIPLIGASEPALQYDVSMVLHDWLNQQDYRAEVIIIYINQDGQWSLSKVTQRSLIAGVKMQPTSDKTSPEQRSPLPEQLIGIWISNSGSYTFKSDGSFEYVGLLQTSLSGCTISFAVYQTGTAAANDMTLTFNIASWVREYKDPCNPSNNYREDVPTTVANYPWRIGVDKYGTERLYLTLPQGESSWARTP